MRSLEISPYQDVVGEVEPARVLLQVVPSQVELEDGVTDIGSVHHVDDVVRDGEAGRGVTHLILIQCCLEGQLQLYAGAAFHQKNDKKYGNNSQHFQLSLNMMREILKELIVVLKINSQLSLDER